MKSKVTLLVIILCSVVSLSFKSDYGINTCYLSFKKASYLTVDKPDTLPATTEKFRILNTKHGEIKTTRIQGYRVVYRNEKNAPFANLKIELSATDSYDSDKKGILDNLNYLSENDSLSDMKVTERTVNGYKIYGSSRNTIDKGMIFGNYVMFPGKGVTVYFYFYNTKPQYRHYSNVEECKKLLDKFLDEYTRHLKSCK